jgi:hypothetical protein
MDGVNDRTVLHGIRVLKIALPWQKMGRCTLLKEINLKLWNKLQSDSPSNVGISILLEGWLPCSTAV